jgi:hypothetical protein
MGLQIRDDREDRWKRIVIRGPDVSESTSFFRPAAGNKPYLDLMSGLSSKDFDKSGKSVLIPLYNQQLGRLSSLRSRKSRASPKNQAKIANLIPKTLEKSPTSRGHPRNIARTNQQSGRSR